MRQRSNWWHGSLALLLYLLSTAAAFASPDFHPLPPSCNTACVSPYGDVLGMSSQGTKAYSNCKADCVIAEPNRENAIYSGIKWQCVEYARRWLIQNRGLTFGDVDTAADIWKIETYTQLGDRSEIFVSNQLNGSTQLPQQGDLLIYAKEFLGTGHVAVVIEVDKVKGLLKVGEQNYENKKWPANYARSIPFIQKDDRYWVLDAYLLGWKQSH